MNIQHQITKRIDATDTRRYFLRIEPGRRKLLSSPFKMIDAQFVLEIGGVNYEFKHSWLPTSPPHVMYVDVPSSARCTKISAVLFNKNGEPIPPFKVIPVSDKFEDVYEKTLHFERKEDEDSPAES